MCHDTDDEAFKLRFQAEIQDEIARRQALIGNDTAKAKAEARKLRVRADLIDQGVPPPSC